MQRTEKVALNANRRLVHNHYDDRGELEPQRQQRFSAPHPCMMSGSVHPQIISTAHIMSNYNMWPTCSSPGIRPSLVIPPPHPHMPQTYEDTQSLLNYNINLMCWNLCGWTEKNVFIRTILINKMNPDILCISESHEEKDRNIEIENYKYSPHNITVPYK